MVVNSGREKETVMIEARGVAGEAAGDGSARPIGEMLGVAIQSLEERFVGFGSDGVRTGYHDLDEVLGDLRPGSLTILASRPAVGKTTMAMGAAVNVARCGRTVLFATNESSVTTMVERIVAAEGSVDGARVRDGRLRERDWSAVGTAVGRLHNMPLHLVEQVGSLDQLGEHVRDLAGRSCEPSVIVIDRLDPLLDGRDPRRAVERLRRVALDVGASILATTGRPVSREVAESVAIIDDRLVDLTDAVVILDRPAADGRAITPLDVRIVKNRFGPTGRLRLGMRLTTPAIVNAVPQGLDDPDAVTEQASTSERVTRAVSSVRFDFDRFGTALTLLGFAFLDEVRSGAYPFVAVASSDVAVDVFELLPDAAVVERSVSAGSSVGVLARSAGAIVQIESNPQFTTMRVAARKEGHAEVVLDRMRECLPQPQQDTVPLRTWHHDCGRLSTAIDRDIDAPAWPTIAINYPDTVRRSLETLNSVPPPTGPGRLILWHGPPGTGKTTALRALIRSWSPWCHAQYVVDADRLFAEPAYLTRVLTEPPAARQSARLRGAQPPVPQRRPWRLVVAEDADEFLRSTARRDAGAALGRLLNVTDGILGQGSNALVLLTTNEELTRLHPAITRPGRCMAVVRFEAFDAAAASAWLGTPVDGPLTLAELLQRRGDLALLSDGSPPGQSVGQYL